MRNGDGLYGGLPPSKNLIKALRTLLDICLHAEIVSADPDPALPAEEAQPHPEDAQPVLLDGYLAAWADPRMP